MTREPLTRCFTSGRGCLKDQCVHHQFQFSQRVQPEAQMNNAFQASNASAFRICAEVGSRQQYIDHPVTRNTVACNAVEIDVGRAGTNKSGPSAFGLRRVHVSGSLTVFCASPDCAADELKSSPEAAA